MTAANYVERLKTELEQPYGAHLADILVASDRACPTPDTCRWRPTMQTKTQGLRALLGLEIKYEERRYFESGKSVHKIVYWPLLPSTLPRDIAEFVLHGIRQRPTSKRENKQLLLYDCVTKMMEQGYDSITSSCVIGCLLDQRKSMQKQISLRGRSRLVDFRKLAKTLQCSASVREPDTDSYFAYSIDEDVDLERFGEVLDEGLLLRLMEYAEPKK